MANEVEVFELGGLTGGVPVRSMPPLAKQTLTIGGAASAAFGRGASFVTVITTTACRIEFSSRAGMDPAGSGMTFPIAASTPYDFAIVAGRKIIAVAA